MTFYPKSSITDRSVLMMIDQSGSQNARAELDRITTNYDLPGMAMLANLIVRFYGGERYKHPICSVSKDPLLQKKLSRYQKIFESAQNTIFRE